MTHLQGPKLESVLVCNSGSSEPWVTLEFLKCWAQFGVFIQTHPQEILAIWSEGEIKKVNKTLQTIHHNGNYNEQICVC